MNERLTRQNEIITRYTQLRARAQAYEASVDRRVRALLRQAGLDDQYIGISLHNPFVAFQAGHPWVNVDYDLLRQARNLNGKRFRAYRLVDEWMTRQYHALLGGE